MATDLKRLKQHFKAYEPTLKELERKYQVGEQSQMAIVSVRVLQVHRLVMGHVTRAVIILDVAPTTTPVHGPNNENESLCWTYALLSISAQTPRSSPLMASLHPT